MKTNILPLHSTLLAEMQAVETALLDISNNIGYHNPNTEDALMDLLKRMQSIIYAERHYEPDYVGMRDQAVCDAAEARS